jgi:antitoxin VapB
LGTLNIKDPEVRELARQLAERTGQTMTDAVKQALRQQLRQAERQHGGGEHVIQRVLARARETAKLPILDPRSDDEIVGYDENGVPR